MHEISQRAFDFTAFVCMWVQSAFVKPVNQFCFVIKSRFELFYVVRVMRDGLSAIHPISDDIMHDTLHSVSIGSICVPSHMHIMLFFPHVFERHRVTQCVRKDISEFLIVVFVYFALQCAHLPLVYTMAICHVW